MRYSASSVLVQSSQVNLAGSSLLERKLVTEALETIQCRNVYSKFSKAVQQYWYLEPCNYVYCCVLLVSTPSSCQDHGAPEMHQTLDDPVCFEPLP
jgi:hypothetical protein